MPISSARPPFFLALLCAFATLLGTASASTLPISGLRIGEASHPGPHNLVAVGTTNPTGLRGKESLAVDIGPGIFHYSETQLSAHSLPSASRAIRACGSAQNRDIRVHAGAPAPVRTNSSWAGSWSGVLTTSDWPSRSLTLPWQAGAFQTARVQAVQHYLGQHCLISANIYGFAPGFGCPDAAQKTDQLLTTVTQELVIGGRGPRIIAGDFNQDADRLEQLRIWRERGWVEAQEQAQLLWGQMPMPTCKGATIRDFLWLSPEAACLLHSVMVQQHFQEHDTLIATLRVDMGVHAALSWPLPAEIPWESVNHATWHHSMPTFPECTGNTTAWLKSFAHIFEQSLDGHITGVPGGHLPRRCHGRAKRMRPRIEQQRCIAPKPSRPGEVSLSHSLVCLEVKYWFQQLRRLQSLVHALRAGANRPSAVDYRLQLWRAILEGRGFLRGFQAWWGTRPVRHQGLPAHLPHSLPGLDLAEQLYADFHANFKRFESWHIRQRTKLLQAQYEQARELLYRDLRDDRPSQVDHLVLQKSFQVVACDSDTRQVHLDKAADMRGHSTWSFEGVNIEVCVQTPQLCLLPPDVPLCPDLASLEQTIVLHDVSDILSEFQSAWTPRWNKSSPDVQPDWNRLVSFARAFLPSAPFHAQPISLKDWRSTIARLKPRAARGPDGIAKADLVAMPDEAVLCLLSVLNAIEEGNLNWPNQWLQGFVISLAKPNERRDADGYRPICLFAIVYRAWSSLRARQLLQHFKTVMPESALGFIPGREASEMWYRLEIMIELACQGDQPLCGYGTDIVKCFNGLPRTPLLEVAALLGVPDRILVPWRAFLSGVRRRFLIRGHVGQALASTSGFAEGCPLSPFAMCVANLVYHLYLHHYEPRASAVSYADNWSHTASNIGQLASGIVMTQCVADMLDVQLDPAKTFVWGSHACVRNSLKALGIPVLRQSRELGGILSFGSATRNAALVDRCKALAPLFKKLALSRSPLAFKLQILPSKLWARALHGVSGCPLALAHITNLRTQAARALHVTSAGASPCLRLSLSAPMEADPGFYQLWACVRDARRILRRQPDLVGSWKQFMRSFDGVLYHGPFSKLLQVLSQIEWHIAVPPLVVDHEGLTHNLLFMPKSLLRQRLERAWLRHIGHAHTHRATMRDLHGLAQLDVQRMHALDLSRLRALQSGSLLFGAEHARHDTTLTGLCLHCGCSDTRFHRVCECPAYAAAREGQEWAISFWHTLPTCLTHHLLPPSNADASALHALLHAIADQTPDTHAMPVNVGRQHIFTDGSCFQSGHPDFALAAWGAVLADTDTVIGCGQVPGIQQTAPRGELYAVICALSWALRHGVAICIWCDALHVVQGIDKLLHGSPLPDDPENDDLWRRVSDMVNSFEHDAIYVQHVPSHLDLSRTTSAFEDWVAIWNARADRVAVQANQNRSVHFLEVYHAALRRHEFFAKAIRAFRHIYFAIAEITGGRPPCQRVADDGDETIELAGQAPQYFLRCASIQDRLPVNWHTQAAAATGFVPATFVTALMNELIRLDEAEVMACKVSWLELLFLMVGNPRVEFPVQCPSTGAWVPASTVLFSAPLKAACQLRLLRKVLGHVVRVLSLQDLCCKGISLADLRVSAPQDGLLVGISAIDLMEARSRLAVFTKTRPIRSVSDLARPIRPGP